MQDTDMDTASGTVVLVDDDDMIRHLVRRAIERRTSLTVVGEAEDGQAGVELVESTGAAAAIVDGQMPRLDGWEAAHVLRARHPSMVILMFTGGSVPDEGMIAADAVHDKGRGVEPLLDDLEARMKHSAAGGGTGPRTGS